MHIPPIRTVKLLLAAAVIALIPSLAPAQELNIRVLNWNIEWFPGLRPSAPAKEADAHMKATQAELKRIDPDIFIAQEIRDWASFHELCSVVPGLTVHVVSSFVSTQDGRLRNQQLAIASKLRCVGAWWEAWEANEPELARGLAFAALEHPDGGLIMVYSNHFRSNHGSHTPEGGENVGAIRAGQARQLLAHDARVKAMFTGTEILGWINAGDFNTNHDDQFTFCRVVEMMVEGGYTNTWANTPRENRLTWRSDPDPEQRRFEPTTFDYFFTKGDGLVFGPVGIVEVPRELSDHYPIGMRIGKKK